MLANWAMRLIGSNAEYVSDLVDRIVELERVHYREGTKERLYVREVALAVAA